jgi:hypothetical protein
VCRRNGEVVASRGWTQRALVSWHGDFIFCPFFVVGFNKQRLSNTCTLLLVVREELCCTPGLLVVGIERTGLPRVGGVEGLATGSAYAPSFCLFDPRWFCLFLEGFPVNMIVAHGMGLNCIGGRYMKGMVWANDDRMCMGSGVRV